MSFRHLWAVTRKEIQHIFRDRATFILVLITPTAVLLLMTYTLAVNIDHVPLAVLDYDHSPTSRAFIQRITAGEDLDLYAQVDSIAEIEDMLIQGQVKAAVIRDLQSSISAGGQRRLQTKFLLINSKYRASPLIPCSQLTSGFNPGLTLD